MPEIDGVHFEIPILASRACRPQDYDEGRKKMWNQAIASGLEAPPTYPGSIAKPCCICGIPVQIGPRQQAVLEKTPDAIIVCLVDVVHVLDQQEQVGHQGVGLYNLGNPYKEK